MMQRRDLRTVELEKPCCEPASCTKAGGHRRPGPSNVPSAEKMMKSFFHLAVGLAISGPWAYPALAQFGSLAIDSCDDYVARATSQVQMATGCNVGGPRWSLDSLEHMNWCKRASSKDRGREYDERRKALIGCRGYSGEIPIANCNDYAARFRSQLDLAKSLGCSFQGMRWSENLVQHMHWCNRTDAKRHEYEDAARRKELAECKVSK
jgi:hypothetical protein